MLLVDTDVLDSLNFLYIKLDANLFENAELNTSVNKQESNGSIISLSTKKYYENL